MGYFLGSFGFLLLFVYDCNSIFWEKKYLFPSLFLGFILISAAAVLAFVRSFQWSAFFSPFGILFALMGILCLFLLCHTLFFALPFRDTYGNHEGEAVLCKTGVYALCRHPGVLWLFLLLIFSALSIKSLPMLKLGLYLTAWNIAYVVFQDHMTFIKLFKEYPEYKKETPFLIPTLQSIKMALKR